MKQAEAYVNNQAVGIPEWLRWGRRLWKGLSDFAVWPWQQSTLNGPPRGFVERHILVKFYLEISDFQLVVWYHVPRLLVWSLKKIRKSKFVFSWLKLSKVTFTGLKSEKGGKKRKEPRKDKNWEELCEKQGKGTAASRQKKEGKIQRVKMVQTSRKVIEPCLNYFMLLF